MNFTVCLQVSPFQNVKSISLNDPAVEHCGQLGFSTASGFHSSKPHIVLVFDKISVT